jgi:exodeoxyribonuclease VII large subunit
MEKLQSRLLTQHPGEKAAHASRRLSDIERRMKLAASGLLKERGMRLNGAVRQLDALSPLKVMSRGYGLVYGEKQRLVKSVQDISEGEQIQVKLADGELECRVLSLKGDQR